VLRISNRCQRTSKHCTVVRCLEVRINVTSLTAESHNPMTPASQHQLPPVFDYHHCNVPEIAVICPSTCCWCSGCIPCKSKDALKLLWAQVRVTVGCDSLPHNAPICPPGNCTPDCVCRETLLTDLTNLLLPRRRDTGW
jgi:hypothetical protein